PRVAHHSLFLRGRAGPVRGVFTKRTKVRNAALTAAELGKRRLRSGSRSTTLVPWAYRPAVTPRFAREKSYSGRMVSRSGSGRFVRLRVVFFIAMPLSAG